MAFKSSFQLDVNTGIAVKSSCFVVTAALVPMVVVVFVAETVILVVMLVVVAQLSPKFVFG